MFKLYNLFFHDQYNAFIKTEIMVTVIVVLSKLI